MRSRGCRRPLWHCLQSPAAARAAPQERFARKNETQQLRTAFEQLDSNHDGRISADELRGYFEALGHKTKKVGGARRHGRQHWGARCSPLQANPMGLN